MPEARLPLLVVDERVIRKWMGLELAGVQQALVTARRSIGDLAREDAPTTRTRGGETYAFDPDAVRRVNDALSPLARRRFRVPVTFWMDKDVENAAFLQEEVVVDALKALGRIPEDREMRDGRLWLSVALAYDVSNAYPTLFQFAFY